MLQIFKRTITKVLYGLGAALLITTGVIWWDQHATDPERTFWAMLEQSMTTSGVTVQSTQDTNGATVHQTVQYSFGGQNYSHGLTTLTQDKTVVHDENIGTPTADYMRYVDVKTDQKNAQGKPLNLSKVIGVWTKTDNTAGGEEKKPASQNFMQGALGTGTPLGGIAVPIAHFTPELRRQLLTQIRDEKVYQISFADVKKTHVDGRLRYTYTAKLEPVAYAHMMKTFAQKVGLHSLDQLNPDDYKGRASFEMALTVDARSRHLVVAEAVGAPLRQTYSGYDMPVTITPPAHTITTTELQQRLQQL